MLNLLSDCEYNKDFFIPKSFEDAKRIVIGYGGIETKDKWNIETNWIENLLREKNFLNEDSIVLDWGVGVGRLSKMLIDKFGCEVIGVDINNEMLNYAKEYVSSDKFTGILVDDLYKLNKKCTHVIAVWTLQHSPHVNDDIKKIYMMTTYNAKMFIFENTLPVIPIKNDIPWFHLKAFIDIKTKENQSPYMHFYEKCFLLTEKGKFPSEYEIAENTNSYYAFFKKKTNSVFIEVKPEKS